MRFSSGIAAALLSLSAEANGVRLPYAKRADNVTAGIPPPPGTYVPVPTFFSTNSTSSKDGATSYPLDIDTQTAYSVYLATRALLALPSLAAPESLSMSLLLNATRSLLLRERLLMPPAIPITPSSRVSCRSSLKKQLSNWNRRSAPALNGESVLFREYAIS